MENSILTEKRFGQISCPKMEVVEQFYPPLKQIEEHESLQELDDLRRNLTRIRHEVQNYNYSDDHYDLYSDLRKVISEFLTEAIGFSLYEIAELIRLKEWRYIHVHGKREVRMEGNKEIVEYVLYKEMDIKLTAYEELAILALNLGRV